MYSTTIYPLRNHATSTIPELRISFSHIKACFAVGKRDLLRTGIGPDKTSKTGRRRRVSEGNLQVRSGFGSSGNLRILYCGGKSNLILGYEQNEKLPISSAGFTRIGCWSTSKKVFLANRPQVHAGIMQFSGCKFKDDGTLATFGLRPTVGALD